MIETVSSSIKVFRDDLYPFLGGGNKGRKMNAIAKDIFAKSANALVTTGGIQSNHCRAVAIFAAQNKMACTLVLHGNKEDFFLESGNAKIMRLSGAKILFVESASEISLCMDNAMAEYQIQGLKPYYIWGGGHTLEGGKAYIDAIGELNDYCKKENWYPNYIFFASGTGSTQSGILAGLDKYEMTIPNIIGISVARKSAQAQKIVNDFYIDLCEAYNIKYSGRSSVVIDDYLCGGYEHYNTLIKQLSDNSIKKYGFILDTTYTGKAFYGMLDFINKNNINNTNILFWHTGGIFNFLAK
jgi:D-cysteine desulfhydrase